MPLEASAQPQSMNVSFLACSSMALAQFLNAFTENFILDYYEWNMTFRGAGHWDFPPRIRDELLVCLFSVSIKQDEQLQIACYLLSLLIIIPLGTLPWTLWAAWHPLQCYLHRLITMSFLPLRIRILYFRNHKLARVNLGGQALCLGEKKLNRYNRKAGELGSGNSEKS